MAVGLIGRKAGMTRIFNSDGTAVPVTVIDVGGNYVCQVKQLETDGYDAVQVGYGQRQASRVTKAVSGHIAKAKVGAVAMLHEFRLDNADETASFQLGNQITVDVFAAGQKVDVRGVSKGKGFTGAIRRHHFSGQDATHGNSLSHRAPGSIGQNQSPGRVFKGKKMAGHLGAAIRCQQNLELIKVDTERQLLLVKGSVPGATGSHLIIVPTVKQKNKG
ncbi:50S ribosomal protein L3 [Rhodoferax sp. 4810]|uniref:Large ribosomal subunit protein uL3 n=1 Tax=Thiospirillum jenense TaxID=1653858 RepID=A0A839H6G0_9GAMM|nr:50S ribosomal protein L3 [Thiospirillum jenense]MBB1073026.1 50S ribosomal protein L3 [Rhodoferax jenense]MBB1124974.1 50S ribosomal protein L3 [Thiospirillum jenense]